MAKIVIILVTKQQPNGDDSAGYATVKLILIPSTEQWPKWSCFWWLNSGQNGDSQISPDSGD